ncbi:MAG TPA: rhodanese-like domain-containing protein [Vicinamibacteria bacterium]|jgi:rhodanese-related sulfurtransferase|nr:rhodanese-like domain-containing protein [Vicinamibacteria bacterium]
MRLVRWRVAAIVVAGAAAGLLWNAFSGRGLALRANAFLREGDVTEEIPAAEAKRRLDRGALFLDARPADFYPLGHIPGALSLPEDDFDRAFVRLEPTLRSRFDIVVYCSGFGCEASHIVARGLREKGVAAAVLLDGWPAWTEAGYPTRAGSDP